MGPTQFQYRALIIKRKLGINTGLCALGIAYAAAYGLTYSVPDFVVLTVIGVALYRIYDTLTILVTGAPAIVISDDGVRDALLGDMLIPWTAISEIKTIAPANGFAIGLLLMVDAAQLRSIPGPISGRIVNFLSGARPGRVNRRMALLMTPAAALDTTLSELIDQIRARASAARIPILRDR
jgi:hypothetical protein